jgi:hypothetical protein
MEAINLITHAKRDFDNEDFERAVLCPIELDAIENETAIGEILKEYFDTTVAI